VESIPEVKDIVAELEAVCVDINTILPPTSPASIPLLLELKTTVLLAVGVKFRLLKLTLESAMLCPH
jgi:hypothetical protein